MNGPSASTPSPAAPSPSSPQSSQRRRRQLRSGQSLLAQGEPIVWLIGAGLVICLTMILCLLSLLVYQGLITFWPRPIVQIQTVAGRQLMGEVTRREHYEVGYDDLSLMEESARSTAQNLLNAKLLEATEQFLAAEPTARSIPAPAEDFRTELLQGLGRLPLVSGAPDGEQKALLASAEQQVTEKYADWSQTWLAELVTLRDKQDQGAALAERWLTAQGIDQA